MLRRTSTNNSPGIQQEQPPQPGRKPLTGIDDHPSIWAQPDAAFTSQQNICFPPLASGSWELLQRREPVQATPWWLPSHTKGTEKKKKKKKQRTARFSQEKQLSFQEIESGIRPVPPYEGSGNPLPWNQAGKNQLLLSARCQTPCQVIRTKLRKRHRSTLREPTDKRKNTEKGICSIQSMSMTA